MFKVRQIQGNWPVVMIRHIIPRLGNDSHLFGYFSYVNGEITSLDGDNYSLDSEYNIAEIDIDDDYGEFLVLTYIDKEK